MPDETSAAPSPAASEPPASARRTTAFFVGLIAVSAVAAALITALLVNIFTRKQEGKQTYVRVVDVTENVTDPAVWGRNWPRQYDAYQRTVDTTHTQYGGSEALPQEKIDRDPWLKRMFLGYAFSISYRDRRGHAYMLSDQETTPRVLERPQGGACMHCHASITATYRRLGATALGRPFDVKSNDFDWPSVFKGFELLSAMNYVDAHRELLATPDGSPETNQPAASPPPAGRAPTTREALAAHAGEGHPVSCVDCHDPTSMELRVSRPGFVRGIQLLAASQDPVPHLPSVERWRKGSRAQPYDPNVDASRQEMRSFVCAQCHVEYYCGPKETLFFPWKNGLKVEQIEKTYDEHKFPDGTAFLDYVHAETGAAILKAQHPEFELWSQGTHARAGVACADCHMPYKREGAMKISDHWVRSPLLMINRSCQVCHNVPEDELRARVATTQERTNKLMQQAGAALMDHLDAIASAKRAGATPAQLKAALDLHRKAQWRLDFVAAENSMGFHADQESARILAEAIDLARQGQIAALKAVTPQGASAGGGGGPATRPAGR